MQMGRPKCQSETGTTGGRAPIRMKNLAARLAREVDLVVRIAYCVTTGRNTEYAIRTVAYTTDVSLTLLLQLTIMLFSKSNLTTSSPATCYLLPAHLHTFSLCDLRAFA